jgi:hypothetical protein
MGSAQLCTSFLTREGTTSCSLSNAVSTSHIDSMSAMMSTPVKILLALEGATSMLTYGSLLGSSSTAAPNVSPVDVALMPVVPTMSLPFGEVDPLFSPDPEVSSRTTWSLVKEGGRCPRRKAETSIRPKESRHIGYHHGGKIILRLFVTTLLLRTFRSQGYQKKSQDNCKRSG